MPAARFCANCDVLWPSDSVGPTGRCPACPSLTNYRHVPEDEEMPDELEAWSKINHDRFELFYQEREIARGIEALDTLTPDDFATAA